MKYIFIIISLTFCSHSYSNNETFTVGNTNFIHLINEDSIWWFEDHLNKKFITTNESCDEANLTRLIKG